MSLSFHSTTTKRVDAIESGFFYGFGLMIDCQKKGEPRARSRQTRYRNSFPATMRVTLVFEVQTHSESHKQKNIIWERQQATVTREKNMR